MGQGRARDGGSQNQWQRGTNENTNRLLRQYLPHGIDLSTFSRAQVNAIGLPEPFAVRVQAALRIELVVILWLVAAIGNVARLRFFSERDIAGSGSGAASGVVREGEAILQNTLEQVVLAVLAHLVVVATLERSTAPVAALAGLFSVGRVLFWAGYRRGARARAFGFGLTFYPSILALVMCAIFLLG